MLREVAWEVCEPFRCKGDCDRRPVHVQAWLQGILPLACLTTVISVLANRTASDGFLIWFFLPVFSILAWTFFALSTKRLHDRDKPASYCLFSLIPICWMIVLVFLMTKGRDEDNRYGSRLRA